MNGYDLGAFIAEEIGRYILIGVVIGAILGLLIFWGVPFLWELFKPTIHEVTR